MTVVDEPAPAVDPPVAEHEPVRWLWPFVLVIAVLVTFGKCVDFEFLAWDDDLHLTANERFNPLTWNSFLSFWRAPFEYLYIPVSYTLFSAEVFFSRLTGGPDSALNPTLFHAVSLLLHIGNTLLVFALLRRWDHDAAAACAGALLFALHPLQVESVAWVSEQRGLLSALLSLVSLWFYSRGEVPSGRDYIFASLAFALAMLAKPTAVLVPLMGFAIDYGLLKRPWTVAAVRLTPWLGLSAAVMIWTRAEQFLGHIEYIPRLAERWWIAADSLGWYLAKLIWPLHLCFDEGRPSRIIADSGVSEYAVLAVMVPLLGILATAFNQRKIAAAVAIAVAGQLPVLGLIPFVFQNISTVADRYTYVSMLGVALVLSHFLAGSVKLWRWTPAIGVLMACAVLSFFQADSWRNTVSLCNHALEVNPKSWTAHHLLGIHYHVKGQPAAAREHFEAAIKNKPNHALSLWNLGVIDLEEGRYADAERLLRRAVEAAPKSADAHLNLGNVLAKLGRRTEAIEAYRRAIEAAPRKIEARTSLARELIETGQVDEALEHAAAALELRPKYTPAVLLQARVFAMRQQFDQAETAAKQAVTLNPSSAQAHELLGTIAFQRQRFDQALVEYDAALKLNPQLVEASFNRALVLQALDRKPEAIEQMRRALRLAPPDSPLLKYIRDELEKLEKP